MKTKKDSGQALVVLMVIVAMMLTITAAAVMVTISSAQATSKYHLGEEAYLLAQSGVEMAILSLLRNPNYTGETMALGPGQVEITVSGGNSKIVTATAIDTGFRRTVRVSGSFVNNSFVLQSWEEVY